MGQMLELTAGRRIHALRPIAPTRPASRAADSSSRRRSSASTATSGACATASPRTATSRSRRRYSTATSAASTSATRPRTSRKGRELKGRAQIDAALRDVAAARDARARRRQGRRRSATAGAATSRGWRRRACRASRARSRITAGACSMPSGEQPTMPGDGAFRRARRDDPRRRRAQARRRASRGAGLHLCRGPRLQLRPAGFVRRRGGEARARAHAAIPAAPRRLSAANRPPSRRRSITQSSTPCRTRGNARRSCSRQARRASSCDETTVNRAVGVAIAAGGLLGQGIRRAKSSRWNRRQEKTHRPPPASAIAVESEQSCCRRLELEHFDGDRHHDEAQHAGDHVGEAFDELTLVPAAKAARADGGAEGCRGRIHAPPARAGIGARAAVLRFAAIMSLPTVSARPHGMMTARFPFRSAGFSLRDMGSAAALVLRRRAWLRVGPGRGVGAGPLAVRHRHPAVVHRVVPRFSRGYPRCDARHRRLMVYFGQDGCPYCRR